jgi:hypothetical protein
MADHIFKGSSHEINSSKKYALNHLLRIFMAKTGHIAENGRLVCLSRVCVNIKEYQDRLF